MKITDFIVPAIIAFILIFGLFKKVDVFTEFVKGAKESLKTGVEILPTLIILMTCVGMFSSSGAAELIAKILSPLTGFLGFPPECIPLALLRPVSGSGAISIFETILSQNDVNSFPAVVAAVMLGSTETTFYTLAVYFSVTKVKKTRHALIASSSADITSFVMSALTVRLLMF